MLIGANIKMWLRQRQLLLVGFAVTFSVLFQIEAAYGQGTVGYVLERTGEWTLNGTSNPVSLGSPLPSRAVLRNRHPADNDKIIVADLNWQVMKQVHCHNGVCNECRPSGACYDSIQPLPEAPPQPDVFGTTFAAVMDLFVGKPERYSVHRERSIGGDLTDAVLPLINGKCDIRPVFASRVKGTYQFRLESISALAGSERMWESDPLSFAWNPRKPPPPVSLTAIVPGLYKLRLSDNKHGTSASDVDAWVLLCRESEYQTFAGLFENATRRVTEWGQDVSLETSDGYLRAMLEYEAAVLIRAGEHGGDK